jgi:hypothetical protein
MEGVIKVYDFLDTAFTCAIPAGTGEHLYAVILEGGYGEALREFEVTSYDCAVIIDTDSGTGADAYLNVFYIVTDGGGAFKDGLTTDFKILEKGYITGGSIIMSAGEVAFVTERGGDDTGVIVTEGVIIGYTIKGVASKYEVGDGSPSGGKTEEHGL